ncbi:hypothetical protein MASR2M15_01270 [Anaerolineales bacterium]
MTQVVCMRCGLGRYHFSPHPFTVVIEGEVICVPNIPLGICDVCQNEEFDYEALTPYMRLVDQNEEDFFMDLLSRLPDTNTAKKRRLT